MARANKETKYVLLVGDGMADYGLGELGGKTPLQAAKTVHMDHIAAGQLGLVKTIPDGFEPGSDVANLSLLGYDPRRYHAGRAPFEAASMGLKLRPQQVAYRMNLVTLEVRSQDEIIMRSHSSGDISTEEALPLVACVKQALTRPGLDIYPGVAYRHLLVWENGPLDAPTIPPHDVLDQNMAGYLKKGPADGVIDLIRASWDILKDHPVNRKRKADGRKEANSIWLWGQGRAPDLPTFNERFGLRGGVISAVDLIKGIGVYAGFKSIPVAGATGYLNTNFRGKARAALEALRSLDFVLLHVEAPDEASHQGNIAEKIEAIEAFDEKVVGPVLEGLKIHGDYRVLVASDHLTPIVKRTHSSEPTLFAWARKSELESPSASGEFNEAAARESGLMFEHGHTLIQAFLDAR
jgi:2,3-bisphosphoglycerate-independent phosphoglycerate mutase